MAETGHSPKYIHSHLPFRKKNEISRNNSKTTTTRWQRFHFLIWKIWPWWEFKSVSQMVMIAFLSLALSLSFSCLNRIFLVFSTSERWKKAQLMNQNKRHIHAYRHTQWPKYQISAEINIRHTLFRIFHIVWVYQYNNVVSIAWRWKRIQKKAKEKMMKKKSIEKLTQYIADVGLLGLWYRFYFSCVIFFCFIFLFVRTFDRQTNIKSSNHHRCVCVCMSDIEFPRNSFRSIKLATQQRWNEMYISKSMNKINKNSLKPYWTT